MCNFTAKVQAIALPSQAIATVRALPEKLIDSLKFMGGAFAILIAHHTDCNISTRIAAGRSKVWVF